MLELFSPAGFFNPQLSLTTQAAIRSSYGVLLLATLVMCVPHWKRFFLSERWGGYGKSSTEVDLVQNPIVSYAVLCVWLASAISLIVGWHAVASAGVNLMLCRYFFVSMRWNGLLRGFGAPGFMTYWLGLVVFFLELTTHFAPDMRSLALLVAQVDFALIMLSSGLYKLSAGYARNNGMDYGMVNPEWGYWWQIYRKVSPKSLLFKTLNQLAWSTEVIAAILMLVPETRFLGAMLILLSFVFIATQIRLGVLCEIVIVGCFLFFHSGSLGDHFLALCTPSFANWTIGVHHSPELSAALLIVLTGYLLILPLAHAGLFYNFYAHKPLHQPLQLMLEKYTNFFGIIIWRVFSADHTNFFPRIYCRKVGSQERELISRFGWRGGLRFDHVGESIVLTCLFTTLKYFSNDQQLFDERLLRYARTLPCPLGSVLEFEYISIRKGVHEFEFVPACMYVVDPKSGSIEEIQLDPAISPKTALPTSPLVQGSKPGSYVPRGA